MSILKFEPRAPRSLTGMYEYLTDTLKTSEEGIFAIGCNPRFAAEEMQFVRDYYNRHDVQHYIQVIFAFDEGLFLPIHYAKQICSDIGYMLLEVMEDQRQIFGAIHYLGQNSFKIHCHYMINYVGIYGNLYKQRVSLRRYKLAANEILYYYNLTPIVIYQPDLQCSA